MIFRWADYCLLGMQAGSDPAARDFIMPSSFVRLLSASKSVITPTWYLAGGPLVTHGLKVHRAPTVLGGCGC